MLRFFTVKRKVRPSPTFTKALIETIPEAEDFVQGLPNDGDAKHDREKDLIVNSESADDPEIESFLNQSNQEPRFPKFFSMKFPRLEIDTKINVIATDLDIKRKIGFPRTIKK